MQLPVPERSVADTDSFPVAPDGVAAWIATLDPLNDERDAAELLRGLMHSNRLHNDVDRRRVVIACFVPPLRALHEHLGDVTRAQPLPLSGDFARAATLASSLLREESTAFRLLLADSPTPRAEDARRAMLALVRRGELLLNGHATIPGSLLANAHALHGYAHRRRLAGPGPAKTSMPGSTDTAPPASTGELYRHLLVLTVMDAPRHRARQLPLLLDWLRDHASLTQLGIDPVLAVSRCAGCYALDPRSSIVPAPTGSVITADPGALLVLDARPLIAAIDAQLDGMRQARASRLGADTLERQTLARLRLTFSLSRERRHGRRREDRPIDLTFAHKDICAALRYGAEPRPPGSAPGWRVVDSTPAGLQVAHADAPPGSVQVGELVAVPNVNLPTPPPANAQQQRGETRRDLSLAIVRRVTAGEGSAVIAGLELLARAVMPVTLYREDDPDSAPEQALIIACRIGDQRVQSVLVQPFLYQAGDRLRAVQGPRSRRVELTRCLQLNGLFSHYVLSPAPHGG